MIQNFTPLDLKKLASSKNNSNPKKNSNDGVDSLLLLATIMAAILAILLFFLIQKRITSGYQINIGSLPVINNLLKTQ